MAKMPTMEVNILDLDEAKELVERLRKMTRYALDVEMLYRSTGADPQQEASEWLAKFRRKHGITDADMEVV